MQNAHKVGSFAKQALILKSLAAITTYFFTILLTRNMSVNEFGIVATILNLVVLAVTLSLWGQGFTVQKFSSVYVHGNFKEELEKLFGFALKRSVFGFIIVICILQLGGLLYSHSAGHGSSYLTYSIATLLIPIMGVLELQTYVVRAHHLITLAIIPKEIAWRLLVALAVVFATLLFDCYEITANYVVLSLIVSGLAVLLIQNLLLRRRKLAPKLNFNKSGESHKWKTGSVPFWITSTSAILFTNIDVVVVGLLFGNESAAVYFVANRLSLILTFFHVSFNFASAPLISDYFAKRDFIEIGRIVRISVERSFYPTLGFGIFLIVLAPHLLGLFGESYTQGSAILIWLVLASIINSAFGSPDILLILCGHERACMRSTLVSMFIGLLSILIGGLLLGVTGVSIGVLIALACRKIMYWKQAKDLLSIRTDIVCYLPVLSKSRY